MKPKLDCLVIRPHMEPEEAKDVAEAAGWDASESEIRPVAEEKLGEWFAKNSARYRVVQPIDTPGNWITCFVVTWEDLYDDE